MLRCSICILCLIVAAVIGDEAHRSTWMLLEVSQDGDIQLVAARESTQPPSMCKSVPSNPESEDVVIRYHHPDLSRECVVPIRNPRAENYDYMGADGKLTGGIHQHERTHFSVSVHPHTTAFHAHDMKNRHKAMSRHFISQEHHAKFNELESQVSIDASSIEMTTLQIVGPIQEQKNIVFISAGFTAAEKTKFDDNVASLMQFLQLSESDKLSSQPYRRYFSMMNFFKVWHPSEESGASHPAPAGSGVLRKNNLDCTYGSTSARILVCNRAKVQIVGSYAPPDPMSTLLMVIVNDGEFGGTGGSRVCTTYNGDKMNVIFIHETGHAGYDLSDEYDYGYSEKRTISMLNCHWSSTDPPWQKWITTGILPRPTPVCTYSNYYKPTPATCLMESEQPSYCPVCLSSVLEKMYNDGLNLASPRFPGQYERAYVKLGESVILYINSRVPYHKDETGTFDVSWSVGGYSYSFARGTHAFGFGSSVNGTGFLYPGVGDYVVTATITDKTNIFLAFNRAQMEDRNGNNVTALRQNHTFRVTVYDPATSVSINCTNRSTIFGDYYCAQCDPGHQAECDKSYEPIPLESAIDVGAALGGIKGWLMGIGGVFIVIGIMIFVLIWRTMALHAEHNPREVLPLTPGIEIARNVLLVVQVLMLVGCTVSIIFSIYMYGQLSIFGRSIVLGIVASSIIVWFASFLGFCAAYYKNRSVMFVNFVLLLLLFGTALLFVILLLYVQANIDTEQVRSQLQNEWRDAVVKKPKAVCTMQSVLRCSGFNTSCVTLAFDPAGTTDCPANCETSNKFGDPCFVWVRKFVKERFGQAAIGGIILASFIFVAMVLSLVLGCSIKSRRNFIHKQRRQRHQQGQTTLSPEEIAMLKQEFNKIDKDGSGDLSRQEFNTFYNAVMGVSLSARELEEYFDKLDADGNGVLSFEEFTKVYIPHKEVKRKSIKAAKSKIYAPTAETAEEGAPPLAMPGPSAPTSAQSQRVAVQARPHDIELDLAIEEDNMEIDMSPEESARIQEQRAKEEAARVAEAQAEREKRMAMDRPSNIDVDFVMDDLGLNPNDAMGMNDNMAMDLHINLDDEQFEGLS